MVRVERQAGAEEATLRTLGKGLMVLEALAAPGRAGIAPADLEQSLGMHRVTLGRFLNTLMHWGYVEQVDGTERYRLSLRALSLAAASLRGLTLRDVGSTLLDDLWRSTGETVHLVTLDDGEMVTIDRLEAEHSLTLRTHIGARRPAYCTAAGKAMLAHLPEDVVDAILGRGMPQVASKTITDPERYKDQLQGVRLRGYAVDDEELTDGIRCVAAPVFDFSGRVVGAVTLSAPCVRVDMEKLLDLARQVAAAARRLSRQLGYLPGQVDARENGHRSL